MTCEQCRQQMLPFLYDLLESAERQELAAHLEGCALCQEALKAAQEQQGMLAEAVKEEASDIVFKAPAKATPASTAETVVLPRTPRRSVFLMNRWAAAAAVLLFLFGGGGVIGWTVYRDNSIKLDESRRRLAKAREDLTKAQDELNHKRGQTQKDIRDIQKQIDTLFTDWKEQENKKLSAVEPKRDELPQIVVIGPQSVNPGAKNVYEIELRQDSAYYNKSLPNAINGKENSGQQAPGAMQTQTPLNMQARVINQKTKDVLYQQQLLMQANNRANFDLPPDLPIKPGDNIALEFLTETPEGKQVQMRDSLNLLFPDYVTHLATDRPMYRPGETVRFRSLTLERFSLKPAQQKFHLRYRIVGPRNLEIFNKEVASELVADGAKAEPLKGPGGAAVFGVGVGEFALPADLAEGDYTLKVSEINERFHEEKRSFLVRRPQVPRLTKEVQFHRSAYGPGDAVKILVRVVPAQGQAFRANIQLQARVVVDGVEVFRQDRQTDNDGRAELDFTLPAQILRGVGVVTIECNDGGNVETIVRSLPIVLRDLHVDFYPEGGELIAGVPNRVYFQVRTPAGRPADLAGAITAAKTKAIVRIQTLSDDKEPAINQGLGSFTFTPKAGNRYWLRIDSPIGLDTRPIPLAWGKDGLQTLPRDRGVVLKMEQAVADGEINLTLHNVLEPRDLLIGAYCRGRMLDHRFVKARANQTVQVALQPQADVGGVYRITVFERTGAGEMAAYRPLAERLIYRKNARKVEVAVQCDRPTYQPGETVKLSLEAFNEKREPAPALAMVAVVDASVLKLRDEKTARAMPTHFLLTTEIRDPEELEHADFFLGDHAKAAESLDLLLGTQGWRRFAEQDPKAFQQARQNAKAPIFLANSAAVPQFLDAEQKQIDKLDEKYLPKAVELQKKLAVQEKAAGAIEKEAVQLAENAPQPNAVRAAQDQIDEANRRLREMRMFLVQFGLGGTLLTLLFIGFYLISVGLSRLSEGGDPRRWLIGGLSLLGALFLISVIGTFALMGEPIVDDFRFDRADRFGGGRVKLAMPPGAAIAWEQPEIPLAVTEKEMLPADEAEAAPAAGVNLKQVQMQPFPQRVGFDGPVPPPPFPQEFDERQQRQQGNYQAIVQNKLGRRVQLPPAQERCVVREFAHRHKEAPDGVARDFAETLCWQPVLVLGDGKAQLQFDLSDAVTRFQVMVLSHTLDGRLGANSAEIVSKLPFSIEPKTPPEVTQTDQIAIPVAVRNESAKKISAQVSARVKGLQLAENAERTLALEANQAKRVLMHVQPTISEGTASVRIVGKHGGHSDGVERKFKVVPDGFPIAGSFSGVLENAPIEHEINLPADFVPDSLKVQAHFYPTPAAELAGALEAMRREPAGCFEQSSSSNYPNTLILHYLKQAHEANPLVEKRALKLVQSGYQRMAGFECTYGADGVGGRRGYEWFGGAAPPNEALTAFGLLQFRDMARFTAVDDAMLKRTEKFLLEKRDGKGGFQGNSSSVTSAYIVWALTESGVPDDLDVELAALKKACKTSKDPYLLSLTALGHLNRKKTQQGIDLLHLIRAAHKEDGEVAGARTSITGSQGHDLAVETTALAVLAYVKADRFEFEKDLGNAVRWLGKQRRDSGAYGGTQATFLALKAMLACHQRLPNAVQGGDVQMFVRSDGPPAPGGNVVGAGLVEVPLQQLTRASFSPRTLEPITLLLRGDRDFHPGKNMVQLSVNGNNVLPYTLSWSYRTLKNPVNPRARIKIATRLPTKAKEGETVKLGATIESASGKDQGMTVAIIGIPAGLAIPDDAPQLKALVKAGKISAWELRGRELVLYWRDLASGAKIDLELELACRLPGVYRGPASRAYLYYDADHKDWAEPLNIRIVEAEGISHLFSR